MSEDLLKMFGCVPIQHSSLLAVLHDYKTPNDKIHRWLQQGCLLQVKRGLYVVSPQMSGELWSLPLVANVLYGPSYVSLDYALFYHGLIPEGVVEVSSVTTRRSKFYKSDVGRFSYTHLPLPYYSLGIIQVKPAENVSYLMASREKALCDSLLLARNLRVYSVKGLESYLQQDLRLDFSELAQFDIALVKKLAESGTKSALLGLLVTLLESLSC
jgi:hypothetical protein